MLQKDVFEKIQKILRENGLAELPESDIYDGSGDDSFVYDEKECLFASQTIREKARRCFPEGWGAPDVTIPEYAWLKTFTDIVREEGDPDLENVLWNSTIDAVDPHWLLSDRHGLKDRRYAMEEDISLVELDYSHVRYPSTYEMRKEYKDWKDGYLESERLTLTPFRIPEYDPRWICRYMDENEPDRGRNPETCILTQLRWSKGDAHNVFYNVRRTEDISNPIGACGVTVFLREPDTGYLELYMVHNYRDDGYPEETLRSLVDALIHHSILQHWDFERARDYGNRMLELNTLKIEVNPGDEMLRRAAESLDFECLGDSRHRPCFYGDTEADVILYRLDIEPLFRSWFKEQVESGRIAFVEATEVEERRKEKEEAEAEERKKSVQETFDALGRQLLESYRKYRKDTEEKKGSESGDDGEEGTC